MTTDTMKLSRLVPDLQDVEPSGTGIKNTVRNGTVECKVPDNGIATVLERSLNRIPEG